MSSAARQATPLEELLLRGEDARLEVVDGVLCGMETTGEHAGAQAGVLTAVRGSYHRGSGGEGRGGGWWIYVEPTIQLTIREVYRPDLAGWKRDGVPERPVGFPIRHVPDWVCEVPSPGNAQHDLQVKRRAYHAAKVGYYWIVDPAREEVTILRWSLDGYVIVEVEAVEGVLRALPFEQAEIRLGGLFGRD